jgi:hypothetical protein
MKSFRNILTLVAVVLLVSGYAMAGTIVTYSGQDDGAAITGPFPNSYAAQEAFDAVAGTLSPIGTIDFENQPLGYNANFTAAPGVTVSLTGPNYGDGFSGISTTTFGNLYGFNTTPGGANWLGFAGGTATFAFASPTEYFGFWLTGVQTVFTSSLTVTFSDGASQSLDVPINVNGGAQYFGFTDPGSAIASVTISNISNDAWGIDDVQYNTVPEPSSLLLLGGGALAVLIRRKRSR